MAVKASDQPSDSSNTGSASSEQADCATVVIQAGGQLGTSFYDLWSSRRRHAILFMVSLALFVVPFSDTIYLPALKTMEVDLETTSSLIAASVAVYMFTVALAALVWGPASDRYGRKINLILATLGYVVSSIVCIFAPNVGVLIAFRALQGSSVAGFMAVGSAVIADVFPPEQRGEASGLFTIPLLVGPIIGPLLGGGLTEGFGWRSCFICLTVLSGAIILPMFLFLLPETLQYTELQKLKASDPEAAALIKEAEAIDSSPPVFDAPWVPLRYLLEADIAPHAAVAALTFGNFCASMQVLPIGLGGPPYMLSVALIGVGYLPQGVGAVMASQIAGRISDRAAAAHPDEPESRLIYSTLAALVVMPLALLLFGWGFDQQLNLAAPLIGQFFVGAASAAYLPGIFGYLTALKQSASGAASAAVQTMMFIAAGTLIEASAAAVESIGMGPYFTILAGVQGSVALLAFGIIVTKRRASQGRQDEVVKQVELRQASRENMQQQAVNEAGDDKTGVAGSTTV